MKDTFILNNQRTEKEIIDNHKDMFGNKINGSFVKVGCAYASMEDLVNNNLDKWLEDHLK